MTWRARPPGAPDGGPPPRRVAESLDAVARSLGAPPVAAVDAVFGAWDAVVGPALAERTTPLAITRGALVVAVHDAAWAPALGSLSGEILRRVDEVAGPGVATRLEVRVRPRGDGGSGGAVVESQDRTSGC